MQSAFSVLQVLFSLAVIGFGLLCALVYLRKPPARDGAAGSQNRDERPWRRVGAAICLLVSVMFVVGVYVVDTPDHPRAYAGFWVVIMGLVLWLCVLAIKDVRYTQQKLARLRRAKRANLKGMPNTPQLPAKDSRS